MKQKTSYVIYFLMLLAMAFGSCQKDLVTYPKGTTVTVSTVAKGYYDWITVDKTGNTYALKLNYGTPDTIYKIDATGNRSAFYTVPVTMDHDTVVVNPLDFLSIDSLNNIYTVQYSTAAFKSPAIIKITTDGTASTLFTNFSAYGGLAIQKLLVSNGNIYFNDGDGLHKITAGGSSSVLLSYVYAFAVGPDGSIFYPVYNASNQIDITQLSPSGTKTIIAGPDRSVNLSATESFDQLVDLSSDNAGNIYTSESSNTVATIHRIAASTDVVTKIISTPYGQVDGPLATAQISIAFSLATNSTGLYFTERTAATPDIRKITINK